jgi:predicted RNase H-like HicB family nuclease
MNRQFNFVIHQSEEGGFWAEVPEIPGCATQGETIGELRANLKEAILGCLSVDVGPEPPDGMGPEPPDGMGPEPPDRHPNVMAIAI